MASCSANNFFYMFILNKINLGYMYYSYLSNASIITKLSSTFIIIENKYIISKLWNIYNCEIYCHQTYILLNNIYNRQILLYIYIIDE